MANELDELTGPVNQDGRDVNVIEKQIPVKVGAGSVVFEVFLWVLGILPGLIFLFMKISARKYLAQLQQRIQRDASQIDNYLEQRVIILSDAARIVERSVNLDKDVMLGVAKHRSGGTDAERNDLMSKTDKVAQSINVAFENYPELRAHDALNNAMQQNRYLQNEITAARDLYNDTLLQWNRSIQEWPTKMIVAAKLGYTTRIPFTASKETKERARQTFF